MNPDLFPELGAPAAFARYEAVRHRLPNAVFPSQARRAANLGEISESIDVFVFDAFGVLNVGETPIAGARERVAALVAAGKRCFVVTNAASYGKAAAIAKFRRLGFDFPDECIVASRMAAERSLTAYPDARRWGVAAPPGFDTAELAVTATVLRDEPESYETVDGFLLLSSSDWSPMRQSMLEDAMRQRARPVVVANPDLVAPREDGFSTEPGWAGHRLADIDETRVTFHGKPFGSVYDIVRERLGIHIAPHRFCMVGDTLHTDILGGASQGWKTALVSDHGLLRTMDIDVAITQSGIVPDFIV
nr:HAD hydrolase-like protein [Rhizobiaceae bacterium]